MRCTTSVGAQTPKIVKLPFRWGAGASVMKNCRLFVSGPRFAMQRSPGRSWIAWAQISSGTW